MLHNADDLADCLEDFKIRMTLNSPKLTNDKNTWLILFGITDLHDLSSVCKTKQPGRDIFLEKKQQQQQHHFGVIFTCICKDSEDFSHRRLKIKIGTDIQQGTI